MKTVIFASVVFILCIAAVFANCVYITAMTDSLLRILEASGDEGKEHAETLKEFSKEWEKNRFIIALSVNGIDIDEVNKTLAKAKGYSESKDTAAVKSALNELTELVRAIAEDEKFSVEGIL